jgi:hypothetical protein
MSKKRLTSCGQAADQVTTSANAQSAELEGTDAGSAVYGRGFRGNIAVIYEIVAP